MNCPNCGKEAQPGALFCTGCGCRLDNVAASDAAAAETGEQGGADEGNFAPTDADDAVFESIENEDAKTADAETDAAQAEASPAADETVTGGPVLNSEPEPFVQPNAESEYRADDYVPSWAPKAKTAAADDGAKKPPVKPLSTWSFIWREFVFMIPIVNVIVLFVLAFAEGVNKNSRSFARARLIYMLIGAVIFITLAVLVYIFSDSILDAINGAFKSWYEALL